MGMMYEPIFRTRMDDLFDLECSYSLNRPRHTVTIYNNQFTHKAESDFVFLITYNPINQMPMMIVVQTTNGEPVPEFDVEGYTISYKAQDMSSITYLPQMWADLYKAQDEAGM